MKKLLMIVIPCALLAVFGCGQASDTHDHDHDNEDSATTQHDHDDDHDHEGSATKHVDYASIKAQLRKEQQAYAQAWCDKDMAAIGNIWSHDDDITIWHPGARQRVQGWDGPDGVKAFYQAAFDGSKSIDFKISDVLVKVSKTGTAAVVTYYVENDFVDMDGNKGKGTPRVTVVRELVDGKWKSIHGDASFSIAEIQAMK